MKVLFLFLCVSILCAGAQERKSFTNSVTLYHEFQPVVIHLTNGKFIKQNKANIFLKNGSLLYKKGTFTMQANMDQIQSVAFPDCTYQRIDTILASVVDTIGSRQLLLATLIDVEAYRGNLVNNRQITNFEIRDNVNVSSMELNSDEEGYPLMNRYFFKIDGRTIEVSERPVSLIIPKDKRREFRTIVQTPDFSWTEEESLMRILKLF
ncbi:hypothetical protein [Xylanibacter muris]|uniref:Uncharacterized protein n=1 Tax=Xylanibacter muris TaxID=2736290 RepID=A0ABX2AMT4_9BACT|nr:hypothetical protein [Xylanibacter muris]NPD92435.1 hypothetical protein [Xylanibacter muris]